MIIVQYDSIFVGSSEYLDMKSNEHYCVDQSAVVLDLSAASNRQHYTRYNLGNGIMNFRNMALIVPY